MKTGLALIGALFAFGAVTTNAGAEAKVVVTREVNKPATVEIKAGEYVRWVNQTGGTAHVMFGKDSGIQFYLGKGDNRVKFTTAGTYEYTVHVSAVKAHAHTGTVVVK